MSEPIIEVRHLSKSFGTHVVLRDVDFTVKPGDVTCVIGASGSGKSTLLRCINLLETPTAGSILFHGQDIMAKGFDPCGYRARVGMVFQSFNLFNNMTVLENCTAGLRYVLHQDKETAKATALSNLEKREINISIAEEVLKDIISPNNKQEVTPQVILDVVAEHYGVSSSDIIGSKRNAEIVTPRQVTMYLCREITDTPYKAIGILLGNRDHSTVISGDNKVREKLQANDTKLKHNIDIIRKKLSSS